jgi:bifunctional oligoribonuclease and PAP phosphatase NrnA
MNESPPETIPEPLLEVLRRAGNVALFAHTHPDGDALGSLFGLARVLRSLGKEAVCFLEEPVSHLYDFLPASEDICTDREGLRLFVSRAGADIAALALDCGDADRLGAWKEDILAIEPLLVVDHHLAHRRFGTLRWVEPGRSSTGEMVFELGQGPWGES